MNDRPHIGHAYIDVVATLARITVCVATTRFVTGTDENAENVQAMERRGE